MYATGNTMSLKAAPKRGSHRAPDGKMFLQIGFVLGAKWARKSLKFLYKNKKDSFLFKYAIF